MHVRQSFLLKVIRMKFVHLFINIRQVKTYKNLLIFMIRGVNTNIRIHIPYNHITCRPVATMMNNIECSITINKYSTVPDSQSETCRIIYNWNANPTLELLWKLVNIVTMSESIHQLLLEPTTTCEWPPAQHSLAITNFIRLQSPSLAAISFDYH